MTTDSSGLPTGTAQRTDRWSTRIGTGLAATVLVCAMSLAGASGAMADTTERSLSITRLDGSPVGTLFSDWTMVPGDRVTTTVVAHRTGGGASNLLVTLGDNQSDLKTGPNPVEDDVVITVASNGKKLSSSAAALIHDDVLLDLGSSAAERVPIDVTFELPFSSGNATQQQSIDLSVVVIATEKAPTSDQTDPTAPPAPAEPAQPAPPASPVPNPVPGSILPNLPSTGASLRDILIGTAVVTCIGLLLIGKRNRRDEAVDPH